MNSKKDLDDSDFDQFVAQLQAEIDAKDKDDFSEYALKLSNNIQHEGNLPISKNIYSDQWTGPCGDTVKWYVQVENGIITTLKFETDGCITTEIASEQTARMVEGNPFDFALSLTDNDILDALGKFPSESYHCATLTLNSLHKTIQHVPSKK